MDFDDIKGNEKRLLEIGAESEEYLKSISEPDGFIEVRRLFYSRLMRTFSFVWLAAFFLVLANVITLTRESGKPYITTQAGLIIPITDLKSVKQ